MPDSISIEAPVALVNGELVLRIPIAAGGDKLAPLARAIAESDGQYLNVAIKPRLAERLRIGAGSLVIVDKQNGKFTITRSTASDRPSA